MLVTTKIKIDLQRPSYPVVVNAVQGDQNTRQLEISLFSGSVAWMVPDNVAVAMRYCKPDNTNGYYDTMPDGTASFAVSENTVSVLLAPQMLTVPGTVVAQVVLYLGTQTLATFAIYIRVEADPSAGAVTSEDYVNWAQWIKSELDAYLEKLKTNGEFVGGTFVGDVNMNGHALSGLREPVAPDDAATKEYVDKNASTGAVSSVAGVAPDENGNVPLDAASVKALPIGGGTMEGPINMNGQLLSGLNVPTANDHAANMGYVNEQVKKAAPRNLLDNSDFTNPVNQRGAASYNANNGYTIDRWIYRGSTASALSIDDGCITLTKADTTYTAFKQAINPDEHNLFGKTVTVAIKVNNVAGTCDLRLTNSDSSSADTYAFARERFTSAGIILLTTTVPETLDHEMVSVSITITSDTGSYSIEWAALYEGEYTADNLPVYQPKGYGAELAECMRYYYRSWTGNLGTGQLYAIYCGRSGRTLSIPFKTPMRVNPTITLYNPVTTHSNCVGDWEDDSDVPATGVYVTRHHFCIGDSVAAGKMYSMAYEAAADL